MEGELMKTRERTSEVVIVSSGFYRITLYFARPAEATFDRDTVVIESESFLGDQKIHVEVMANPTGNLVKFRSFYAKREIEIVLWLLERYQADIRLALTE